MNVRKEIDMYAAEEHKPILHWLLTRYRMESQFRFVARCHFERYGHRSYEVNRVWYPTQEGEIIYQALSKEHSKGSR